MNDVPSLVATIISLLTAAGVTAKSLREWYLQREERTKILAEVRKLDAGINLEAAQSANQILLETIKALNEDNKRQAAHVDALIVQNKQISTQNEELRAQNRELREQNAMLRKELAELKALNER